MTAGAERHPHGVSLDMLEAPGTEPAVIRLRKAAGAFRTISEVADELHIPQHVLRFWET
jgi:hypothetical protein